jgi:hypothetical protein
VAIENLYPDVAQIGGLSPALQRIFHELSVDLSLERIEGVDSPWWAFIREGPRFSQVVTALNERKFNIDFWYQGFRYGSGWTPDLRDVARAAVAFHLEKASISEIGLRFVWLKPDQRATSHERGAEFFVAKSWQDLESGLGLDQPSLLPLLIEAAKRPELRRLLPFTSLHFLCFSRTTGYPFSHDCPITFCREAGFFTVMASDQKTILGEGDAKRAANIIVANLPPNCGPAIHGTADTLKL